MDEVKTLELSNRFFWLVAVLAAAVVIFVVGGLMYQFSSLPQNQPFEIQSSGSGKVFAQPDIATVSVGMTTESQKSQDAVNQNNTKMNSVVKAMKDLGIDEKDIQTTNYSLSPVYDWTQTRGQVFKGYRLDQTVTIKIRNFDKINDVLDKVTSLGANNVGSLQFTVDNPEKYRQQAREQAIAEAKTKATNLAKSAGLRIVKIVNISEGYNPTPVPMYAAAKAMGGAEDSVAPNVQTGQLEINSAVTLTYRVQ